MGIAMIVLVLLVVVGGYFVLTAMGVIGAAKKSADETGESRGGSGQDKPGFFG